MSVIQMLLEIFLLIIKMTVFVVAIVTAFFSRLFFIVFYQKFFNHCESTIKTLDDFISVLIIYFLIMN